MNKKIHFIGIGGIGMSGIARLLLSKGDQISGSDLKESANTKTLEGLGAKVYIGHEASNIKDADLVVYSSAVDFRNAELNYAVQEQIPVLKRAEILSQLMTDKIGITVSGAHGKTTTTSMISHLLTNAAMCPTVVAGGIVENYCKNSWEGEGKYFVAELDESDGSFLYFYPHISVVTNIDYEHVDYYGNWDNIINAYKKFISQTQKDGLIIACGDDKNLWDILRHCEKRHITYGLSPGNEVYAKDIVMGNLASNFKCFYKGKELGKISLNIPGSHNILNALACISVGMELSIDFDKISKILSEFKGVQRRFQIKARARGITIVEDYGHHPTEISATLKAARQSDFKRLVVIFQPHRYSRTKFLLKEFSRCFESSDYLIITDIYAASEKPIAGVSAQNLFEAVKLAGKENVFFISKNNIIEHLLKEVKDGDGVLFLGAGDINRLSDELAERLK